METDNPAHFTWTAASGDPDGYMYQTSTGQDGLVGNTHLYIPWNWAGIGNEIQIRAQAVRINTDRVIVEMGPASEWSDPVAIVPVPEPYSTTLMFWGILGLFWLGMWKRRRK